MRIILLSFLAVALYGQTAVQPLTCFSNSGVPPVLRAEGFSELAGDVVISCLGGDPAAPFLASIQVFVNTQITSRLLSSEPAVSEALLMIDEPGLERLDDTGAPSGLTTPFCVSPNSASNAAATAVSCNPAKPGVTYQQGTYTVFRAERAKGDHAESSLIWSGIPVTPPGQNRMRTFRISNLRVNAAALGPSNTLIPTQVDAFISLSAAGPLPIDNPHQTIIYVQNGLQFDVSTSNGEAPSSAGWVYSQCSPSEAQRQFFDKPDTAGTLPATGAFRFRESYWAAFMRHMAEGQSDSRVGDVYNTESGLVRPQSGAAGVADTGTRLAVRFTNVPAGVRIFVSVREAAGSSASASAVFVSSSPNGAPVLGSPSATRPVPVAVSSAALLGCDGNTAPAVEIPITQGAGLAVWEVTDASVYSNETLLFTYGVAYRENTEAGLPATGTGLTIGSYAPFYEPGNTSWLMKGLMVAVPRFQTTGIYSEFMRISACGASTPVVNLTSNISGPEVLVDGVAYALPKSFAWEEGETHTIDVVPIQPAHTGVRRVFTGWSNNGSQRQAITVRAGTLNIAAHFKVQYAVSIRGLRGRQCRRFPEVDR